MDTSKLLLKLQKQDDFILNLFNSNQISDEAKAELMEEYNKLQIKTTEE